MIENGIACLKTVNPIFNVNVVPPSHYLSHKHVTHDSSAKIKTQVKGGWGCQWSGCPLWEGRSKDTSRKEFWGSADWNNLLQQTKHKFSLMWVAHLQLSAPKKFSGMNIYGLQHGQLPAWICSFHTLLSHSSSPVCYPIRSWLKRPSRTSMESTVTKSSQL